MKLHPNYIRALEDKYSNTSFEKDIKEYEHTHLYMSYKKVWNCKIFDGTPKLKIINEEYREFTYNYYKYEGKIKKEFHVEQTFYFLNSYYDQHIKGQEIILDVYALKEKNPNKSLEDLYNDMKDKNYEDFEYLEDPYFDRNATVFVISEAIDEDYSPEVICQGNFDISEFDDRGGYNKYTYLEEEGPFKFLNSSSGEWDDVYVEYEDNSGHTYCSLEWKAKGRDGYSYGAISDICLNIDKYGKKMDEWEKTKDGHGIDRYKLTKYKYMAGEKVKLITHQKYYKNHVLDKFDTSKPEELKELEKFNESPNLITSIAYMLDDEELKVKSLDDMRGKDFNTAQMSDKELTNVYLGAVITVFWKVYNSYDDKNDFPAYLFNDFAYIYYHLEDYFQGIQFCVQALEIQEHSSYYDTIGEGWEKMNKLDAAFEWYQKAYLFELNEGNFDFTHVFNYTNTAIKIKKLPEASEGINVLKQHFPKINIDDLLKDYESLSS